MAKELTDLKLSKIKVGYKSEFLGHEAANQEKIYVSGGLFVQLGKKCHQFRYIYRDANGKSKQMTIGRFDPNGDGKNSFNINQAISNYNSLMDQRKIGIDPYIHQEQQKKS